MSAPIEAGTNDLARNRVEQYSKTGEATPPVAYYDSARTCYLWPNSRGHWIPIQEPSLRRQLKPFFREKENKETLSPLDAHINKLQTERDVAYSGPLAGAFAGICEQVGRRLLITESPTIIQSTAGPWPMLAKLFENLLNDTAADQRPFLYGWLKVARAALLTGKARPGQALVMAGPKDCGKSLVQGLVTCLLGGRAAKPYGWMTGATDFNAELFAAEHLMIEDECAGTDIRARRTFGAQLKSVTVNTVQKCHQKNRTALSLEPLWRVTITVNDEPENLMVLPPIDDSLEDKLILLRANRLPMPMPTASLEDRKAFEATLLAELPAFCAFLDGWQIPTELVSQRFGITHFHHPELLDAIDALAPETRLLQLIESNCFQKDRVWTGTAADLETELTAHGSASAYEARRLLSFTTACGTYLGRLASKKPKQVVKERTANSRRWELRQAAQ